MKKNSFDFLWLQLKGYDRVRAIYKLRKNINKFGDKLGKKNMILNNILHKDLIGYKFMDLNITRFFPKEKKINFSNDLIKSQNPNPNSEEIKNNNNDEEQKLLIDQTTKIIVKNLIKSKENKRKSETLSNSSEDKIKNKYFTKIRNEKVINNNDNNNGDSMKANSFKPKNIIQNYKLFHSSKNNKTSIEFYSPKRNHSFKSDYNISPKHFNKNFDITNLIQENENIQNQKPLVNNSNINMSLYNKKIIPKIHILKLRTNKNTIKLQKNYSTTSINHFNNIHPKSRNSLPKKYKSRAETKMKKIKVIKHQSSNGESSRSTNRNNNIDNIGKTLNENFINKGMNTSKTTSFNFFKRKRIPSYIRLPYINKILFPKANSNLGISGIGNNSSSVGNNALLKD